MNVFAKRALILTVLVLCLFGITILGASAAATGSTTANAETDVASIVVDGTTYYYDSLDTAITDAAANGAGTVNVLKSTTLNGVTLSDATLELVGGEGITITRGTNKHAVAMNGTTGSLTVKDLAFTGYSGANVFMFNTNKPTTATGSYDLTLDNVDITFGASGAIYYYNVAQLDVVLTDSSITGGGGAHAVLNSGTPYTEGANVITMELDNTTLIDVVPVNTGAQGTVTVNAEATVGNTYYATLADAVAAAEGTATITLLGDVALTESLVINDAALNLTLDLGGNTITAGDGVIGVKLVAGTVTMKNGTLAAQTDAIFMGTKALADDPTVVLTLADDMIVTSVTDCCVVIYSGTLNTSGKLTTTSPEYCAIQGSGNNDGTVINVTGGEITAVDVALYHPQNGTLNISGGKITGATAVYVKSGTVNITGGELVANGAVNAYAPNNNGCTPTGDALVVENAGADYSGTVPTVSVTGGNFTSTNGNPVASYAVTDATPVTGFVAGGVYNKEVSSDLCADGFVLEDNGDGTFGVNTSYATDADAVADGMFVRLGNTVGGEKGVVYFATLAEAFAASNGSTVELHLLADLTATTGLALTNKSVTINGGNHTLTMQGAELAVMYTCASLTLKDLTINTNNRLVHIYSATDATLLPETAADRDMTVSLVNTTITSTASTVFASSIHYSKMSPNGIQADTFTLNVDATSVINHNYAGTGTGAIVHAWHNTIRFLVVNINGTINVNTAAGTYYVVGMNNPEKGTVVFAEGSKLNATLTNAAVQGWIFYVTTGKNNTITIPASAITDASGNLTIASLIGVQGPNSSISITGNINFKTDAEAAQLGCYFRIGNEGGRFGETYFATLPSALAAIAPNPSDPAQRELTTLYVLKSGYTVSVEQELLDGKSVFITSAGTETQSITFSANVPIWLKNGAWLRLGNITFIMQRRFLRFDVNTTTADNIFEMENGSTVRREPNSSADGNFIYAPSGAGKITFTMKEGSVLQSNAYATGTEKMNYIFNLPNKFEAGSTVTIGGTISNLAVFSTGADLAWTMFRNEDPDVTLTVTPTGRFVTTTNNVKVNSSWGAMIASAGNVIIEGGGSAAAPQFQSSGTAVPPVLSFQWTTSTITIKGTPVVSLGTTASGNVSAYFQAAPQKAKFTSDKAAAEWLGAVARVGEIPAEGGSLGTTYFKTIEEAVAATKDGKVYLLNQQVITADTTFEGIENITLVNATGGALFTVSGTANLTINNATFETTTALINIGATTGTVTIGENAKIYLVGTPASATYLINITGALNGKLDVKGDLYLGKSATEIVTGNGEMGFVNHTSASADGVIDISGDLYAYATTGGAKNGFIYIKAALKELNVSGNVTASIQAGDQVKFIWANAAIANGINFNATANYTLTSGNIAQFIFAQVATAPVNMNGANITFTANTVNGAYSSIVFSKSPVTIVDSTLKVTGTTTNGFPILHNYDLDNVTFTIEDSTLINETTGRYAQLVASQAQADFTTILNLKGEIAMTFADTAVKPFDAKKSSYLEVTDLTKLTVNAAEVTFEDFATAQGLPYAFSKVVDGTLRTYYNAEMPAGATHKVVTSDATYYFGDLASACQKLLELKIDNTTVYTMADVAVVTYKPTTAVDTIFTIDNAFFVDDLALAIELASDGSVIVVNKSIETTTRSFVISGKSITLTGATAGISITNTMVNPHYQMFYVANGGELTITNLTIVTEGRGIAVGSTDASAPAKLVLGAGAVLTGPSGRNSLIASGNLSDSASMLYGEIVIAEGATVSRNNTLNSGTEFWDNGVIMCFYQNFTGSVEIAGTISAPDLVATDTDAQMIQIYDSSVITIKVTGSITYNGTGTAGKTANVIHVGNSSVGLHIAESATVTNTWTGATSNVTNLASFPVAVEIDGVTYKTNSIAAAIALAPVGTLENPTVIKLLQNLELAPNYAVDGKHILITSEGTTPFKITRPTAIGTYMFSLKSGSLAFENVEIQIDGRVIELINYDSAKEATLRIGAGAWIHASANNGWVNSLIGIGNGADRVYADILVEKGAKLGYDAFTATRETQIIFAYSPLTGDITLNGEFYNKVTCTTADKTNFLLQVNSGIEGTVTFGADSAVTFEVTSEAKNAVVHATGAITGGIHLYGTMNVTYKSTTNAAAQAVIYCAGATHTYVYDGAEITLTSSATATHTESSVIYTHNSVTMTGGTLKYAGTFTPGNVIYADHGGGHVTISGNARLISEGVTPNLLQGFSYNTLILTRQPATKVSITGNVYLECHSTSNAISLNNGNATHGASTVVVDGATINFPNTTKICPHASTYLNLKFPTEADAVRFGYALRVGDAYFNSIASAIAASPAGSTIYLTGDVTMNETAITIGKSITIASIAGEKYKLTFPKQYSGWTASTRPFTAAAGITVTFKDIEVYVEGGRLMGFAPTADINQTITFNMVNAFIHGGSIGNNGNAMLSMGSGTDVIYVNINIDANSRIGYDPAPAGSVDYVATRTLQVIMAYGNYAGTMNIFGEIYQDIWSEDVNFGIGWTNGGYENQSILEIHNFSGIINIYGKMYQKVVYPEAAWTIGQPHVAVVFDVRAAASTARINIDWRTAELITEYVNAEDTSGLYKGAGMQGATEVLDAEGNPVYTRFVNLFRDTFKIALVELQGTFKDYRNFRVFLTANHGAGYSGNIGGMQLTGDIEVLWTGDNPYTDKAEQFISNSTGYTTGQAGGTMLMEISGGADLTLEHIIIRRNGRVFSFRSNGDPDNPANLILGEGAVLQNHPSYTASSNNVWVSAGVNDDAKTEIYANFIMQPGSKISLDEKLWTGRDMTVIFSTSVFIGKIVLDGEIYMGFNGNTNNHRLIASFGKTAYKNTTIEIGGKLTYDMTYESPTLGVYAIDVTGNGNVVIKEGADIYFNVTGADASQSALIKTKTAATSQLGLVVEGGKVTVDNGYFFWSHGTRGDATYNIYDGYITSSKYSAIMLDAGATLSVYGGIFEYTGNENGVAPIAIANGTLNVEGGVFKTNSTVAPIFMNEHEKSTMNLNGFLAIGNTSLIANLGKGTPTTLNHTGYGRTALNMLQAEIGARPVFADNADLGFMAVISADLYAKILDRAVNVDNVTFGMLYVETDKLSEDTIFTHTGLALEGIIAGEILAGDENFTVADCPCGNNCGDLVLRGSIAVPAEEYATRYSVVFFAKYLMDEHTVYAYTDFDSSENSRSLDQVVRAAYNDTKSAQSSVYANETATGSGIWSPYTVEQRAVLADWYGDASTSAELKNLDLYLLAGSSNAAGFAGYSNGFVADYADQLSANVLYSGLMTSTLKQTIFGTEYTIPYEKYVPGSSEVGFNRGWNDNTMGTELGMAIALSKQYTGDNYAAIMKFAALDSSISDWNAELAEEFIAMVENEVKLYRRQGYNVTVKGMFWQQGELDAANAATYAADFTTFVNTLRASAVMEDMIIDVATLSAYNALTGADLTENEAFIEMQIALENTLENVIVTDATILPTANGIIADTMDVCLNGQVAATDIMTASGMTPEYIPEIKPVVTITVEIEGEPVEIPYRSIVVAIANMPEGAELSLVDDLTLYSPLKLTGAKDTVINGNGNTITLKPDAGAGIVITNTAIEFKNIGLVQAGTDADSYVIEAKKGADILISGDSYLEAHGTVANLTGGNAKFTVAGNTTITNSAAATTALIVTSGTHVLIAENAVLNANGSSACVKIDATAPYKTTVAIADGTFTTQNNTTTFVNNALEGILVVANDVMATAGVTATNVGFGTNGAYNELIK